MQKPRYMFCATQFKPVIILVVVLTVVVIGWTAYRESTSKHGRHLSIAGQGGIMRTATAPPIRQGEPAPHPDWGRCTRCHDLVGARQAASVMSVATAPPIRPGARAPHPDWGRCTRCHNLVGARTAALQPGASRTMARAAPPLGIWLRPVTPAIADRMGLDNADGALVSGVPDPSTAQTAGLTVGDVIRRIDNRKIESVNEALAVLAEKRAQDTIKLQILREGRHKKIFVPVDQDAQPSPTPAGVPVAAPAAAPPTGRVAVAATGEDLGSQVAPVFGRAPVFIIYDPAQNVFFPVENRGHGALTAGRLAAAQLIGSEVQAVIVGNIGPGSYRVLQRSGVRIYTGAFGSVQQVLAQYRRGGLVESRGTMLPVAPRGAALSTPAAGGKIAVASEGPTLDDRVARDLGLARYVIVYNLAMGEYEAVAKDPTLNRDTGAVQTAHMIVDRGASAVVAGDISPASVRALNKLGVFSFAGVSGSVGRAIGMYQDGKLQATTAPAAGGLAAQGMTL
jgi:predicted Fe-Mo cluster-binding NifX family protein